MFVIALEEVKKMVKFFLGAIILSVTAMQNPKNTVLPDPSPGAVAIVYDVRRNEVNLHGLPLVPVESYKEEFMQVSPETSKARLLSIIGKALSERPVDKLQNSGKILREARIFATKA